MWGCISIREIRVIRSFVQSILGPYYAFRIRVISVIRSSIQSILGPYYTFRIRVISVIRSHEKLLQRYM